MSASSRRIASDPDALLEFIRAQRWFGAKGAEPRDVTVLDVIPVDWPGVEKAFSVARAAVRTDAGTFTYQLFFADDADDALDVPEFRRGLADAFVKGAAFQSGAVRWIVESETKTPLVVPASAPVTLSTSQQTNSSVLLDGEAILKLFRRLEPGVHPDVEVTRFLTIERKFVHVPVLLGTIRFEDPEGSTVAGMLQELVPDAVDGWSYMLKLANYYIAGRNLEDRANYDDAPMVKIAPGAKRLGAVTREMHETLASGDPGSGFEQSSAGAGDVQRWVSAATQMAERAMRSLDRALAKREVPVSDDASAVVARRVDIIERVAGMAGDLAGDAGASTRTHGDYHLGQILRSKSDRFLVIDFEGEPARPLDERRARQSPLRDVAGMLRSFSYAAAAASGVVQGHTWAESRMQIATQWEREMRDAFLDGYFGDQNATALLPRTRANADTLISLFEAEKVFYELQYEIDHRPDWVWLPLRGIADRFA